VTGVSKAPPLPPPWWWLSCCTLLMLSSLVSVSVPAGRPPPPPPGGFPGINGEGETGDVLGEGAWTGCITTRLEAGRLALRKM